MPQDEYANVERVGIVSVKTAADRMPADELSSNKLPEGTEIYKLDENWLLAKVNDREYQLYERMK